MTATAEVGGSRRATSRPTPTCVYAGTWSTFSTTGASGGSYKRANTSGASVTVNFNGTYLAWIATTGTTLGKAYVSLDGGAAQSINLAAVGRGLPAEGVEHRHPRVG